MINIFVCVMFSLFSFMMFSSTFSMNAVNRSLIYLPIEIIKNSVVIDDRSEPSSIYFSEEGLRMLLDEYFAKSLTKYVNSYDYSLTFLNDDGLSYCTNDECQGVSINLQADLAFNFHFDKTMVYTIGERYGR